MCGICGKLNFDREKVVPHGLIKSMADTIHHRGPDDEGYYVSGPLGLGFRRLSIIDLAMGHQPLANEDDTVWIVFNGEIYNYQELREFLLCKGHVFKTRTDTEVIVHLYEEFGERLRREAARHVRLRHLGQAPREALYRPRSCRHQAALLSSLVGGPAIRLGD